jgi:hypothetical protein
MSQKNHEFSVSRFVKTFLALWLATAVNLTSTLFFGHHLDTHATTYLHFPTGYLRLIVSVSVILLILVLKKWKLTDIEKFLIASLLAPVAILLSPTFTGRELEFNSHITFPYSYWMLIAMFYIVVKIWNVKFKSNKFALVVLIFVFLVTENSQMPLQDRPRASYSARTLISRDNLGQLTTLKNQLPNLFADLGVTSIPNDLVGLLFGTRKFKVLSHPYAGFDENDRKEIIERYILNQKLQQSEVSVVYDNRELFGTRILNQCNRFRNFSKIVGFIGFTFDSSWACEISPLELEQIREIDADISRGLLSYIEKYDLKFILTSNSKSLQKYPFKFEILFRTRDYVLLEILPSDR